MELDFWLLKMDELPTKLWVSSVDFATLCTKRATPWGTQERE